MKNIRLGLTAGAVLLGGFVPVSLPAQVPTPSASALVDEFMNGRMELAAAESRKACVQEDARADSIQTRLLALRPKTFEQEAMLIAAWSQYAGSCRNTAVNDWFATRLSEASDENLRLLLVRGMGTSKTGREIVLAVMGETGMDMSEVERLTDLAFADVRPEDAVSELAGGLDRHGVIAPGVLGNRLAGARAQGANVTDAKRLLLRTIESRPELRGADRVFMELDNDAALETPGSQVWRAEFESAARRIGMMDVGRAAKLVRAARASQKSREGGR